MFVFIWDIRLSTLIAGLAGAGFPCADTIVGASTVPATIAGTCIGVFIWVFFLAVVESANWKFDSHRRMAAALTVICIAVLRPLTGRVRMVNHEITFIEAIFFTVGTLAHRLRLWPARGSQPGAIEQQRAADRGRRAQQHPASEQPLSWGDGSDVRTRLVCRKKMVTLTLRMLSTARRRRQRESLRTVAHRICGSLSLACELDGNSRMTKCVRQIWHCPTTNGAHYEQ